MNIIEELQKQHLKKDLPSFRVGDTVSVHILIKESREGKQKKETKKARVQVFTGTVIGKQGKGISASFSVYRSAYGCNMEKRFFIHSPEIQEIKVIRKGKARRSKLYYLRGRTGKKARVQEWFGKQNKEKAKPSKEVNPDSSSE